mmetsp:Transcript_39821/g.77406  ORF Transcript_39821/g.77406 Transcript_39821/m.77406 type:complete len:95 (-) Transcript_39821:832-1116(-)
MAAHVAHLLVDVHFVARAMRIGLRFSQNINLYPCVKLMVSRRTYFHFGMVAIIWAIFSSKKIMLLLGTIRCQRNKKTERRQRDCTAARRWPNPS